MTRQIFGSKSRRELQQSVMIVAIRAWARAFLARNPSVEKPSLISRAR
jgi:hypothetical protein